MNWLQSLSPPVQVKKYSYIQPVYKKAYNNVKKDLTIRAKFAYTSKAMLRNFFFLFLKKNKYVCIYNSLAESQGLNTFIYKRNDPSLKIIFLSHCTNAINVPVAALPHRDISNPSGPSYE